MINDLKQHKVVWTEFVEWMEQKNQWEYINGSFWYAASRYLPDRGLHSLLIEFLDSKGIYLIIACNGNGKYWGYNIIPNNSIATGFDSRPEAEEAGIVKGFEILNQKEK